MINVHGENVPLEEVRRVPLERPPNAGGYWQGIAHGELIDAVLDECRRRGWKAVGSKFVLSPDRADLAGAIDLKVPNLDLPPGQTLGVGLLTSNMQRRRITMVVGTTVRVCSNGLVVGEVVLDRKHTLMFDLRKELESAFDLYADKARGIKATVDVLTSTSLKSSLANRLLMESGRRGLMPWSRVGAVDREYRHPRFAEFKPRTAWSLLNAFTSVVQRNPPMKQMQQIAGFRELIDELAATPAA